LLTLLYGVNMHRDSEKKIKDLQYLSIDRQAYTLECNAIKYKRDQYEHNDSYIEIYLKKRTKCKQLQYLRQKGKKKRSQKTIEVGSVLPS
jgi:hypothetical protein